MNASTNEVSILDLLGSVSIVYSEGAMSELPPYRRAADTLAEISGDQAIHHLVPFLVNASTNEVSILDLLGSASIVHSEGAMSELPPYRRAADTLAEISGDQAIHHLVPFPKSYREAADMPVGYISCDESPGSQCFCCGDG